MSIYIIDENGNAKKPKAIWVYTENEPVKVWEEGFITDEKGYAIYLDTMKKRDLAMTILKAVLGALEE